MRRPKSRASYSVVFNRSGFAKFRRPAYVVLAPEGVSRIAAMPTPSLHQAPSQCMIQLSIRGSSKIGDVQSAMKSTGTCDFMTVLVSKSM